MLDVEPSFHFFRLKAFQNASITPSARTLGSSDVLQEDVPVNDRTEQQRQRQVEIELSGALDRLFMRCFNSRRGGSITMFRQAVPKAALLAE